MTVDTQHGVSDEDQAAARAELLQAWCAQATEHFLTTLDAVDDEKLGRPSSLPGWSHATLVAHVHRNAEALARLVTWARTGVPTPMYASAAQREQDIEVASAWDPAELRRAASASAQELASSMASLEGDRWSAAVTTATGREVPASEIPWLRVREVAIHAVDLAGDASFANLPGDMLVALIEDIATFRARRGADPACRLISDEGDVWSLGEDSAVEVHGTRAHMVAWLSGRSDGADLRVVGSDGVPALTAWL
jgi:maleylpyruvate isomerase